VVTLSHFPKHLNKEWHHRSVVSTAPLVLFGEPIRSWFKPCHGHHCIPWEGNFTLRPFY